jgi:hypothetical protein
MIAEMLLLVIAFTSGSVPLEYQQLPSTTERPFRADPSQYELCAPADFGPKKGPHNTPALKMYLNELARSGLVDRTQAMPVGATIVKEKWPAEDAAKPVAYAAMVKRAAGYDPKHGDWEYVYAELEGKKRIVRGQIASCVACHEGAAKRDYVFGRHLQINKQSPDSVQQPLSASK